jgi:hypothetical protein
VALIIAKLPLQIANGRAGHLVVLQEQSTLPIKNAGRMHENVRLFDAAIKAAGAKTVLYMTWARRHAQQSQQAITDGYTTMAAELGADVIPAGVAWQRVLEQPKRPVLYDRDCSHPTLAGNYLAACCAFAAFFGGDAVGLPAPAQLNGHETAMLQHAAADAVSALGGHAGTRFHAGNTRQAR